MQRQEPEFVKLRREARQLLDLLQDHARNAVVTEGLLQKLFKPGVDRRFLLELQNHELPEHVNPDKIDEFKGVCTDAFDESSKKVGRELIKAVHRLAAEDAVKEFEHLPEREKKVGVALFRRVAELNALAKCSELDARAQDRLAKLTIRLHNLVNAEAVARATDTHDRKIGEYHKKLERAIKDEALTRDRGLSGNAKKLN